MWKTASSCALLLAAVAALQNVVSSSDVLITLPVQIDGTLKDLQLMRGESIEDAAVSFARTNGLLANSDATRVRQVIDQLSGLLKGRMEEIRDTEPPKPTVQLTLPLTIDSTTRDLKKLEGESVESAVERYLYDGGYTTDAMRQLYPQLVQLVEQKMEELQPASKELFSFGLTIDGREATARHFENGEPMEEARETLRGVNINDEASLQRLAPQIANEIQKRIAEADAKERAQHVAQPATPPQQAPSPAKELFSLPLTVNERPTVLIHYDGYTSRESAVRYLNDNGLGSAADTVAQVTQIINNRIAEIAKEQAAEEAAMRAKAEEEAAARAAQRVPAVRLPINFGNGQGATLEYYEGDSIERTVELFLTQIGVEESSTVFAQNVQQLSAAVRQEMAKIVAERRAQAVPVANPSASDMAETQSPSVEPLVTLPVTLSGRVFDLVYFKGEEPATVANVFCVEKHETIRAELGLQFDGDQLLECKNLLERTLHTLIDQKQQQTQANDATANQVAEPVASPLTRNRGDVLFTLDIELDNRNVPLTLHQHDDPEQTVRAFCAEHNIAVANVAPLLRALNDQLAQLN